MSHCFLEIATDEACAMEEGEVLALYYPLRTSSESISFCSFLFFKNNNNNNQTSKRGGGGRGSPHSVFRSHLPLFSFMLESLTPVYRLTSCWSMESQITTSPLMLSLKIRNTTFSIFKGIYFMLVIKRA